MEGFGNSMCKIRWDVETTTIRFTLYDKSVGAMDQTIGDRVKVLKAFAQQ